MDFNSHPGEGKKQVYLAHQHVTGVISDSEIGVAGGQNSRLSEGLTHQEYGITWRKAGDLPTMLKWTVQK